MAIVIKNNRDYVECIRESNELSLIAKQLEHYMDDCMCLPEEVAEDELARAMGCINRCIKSIDEYRQTLVEKVKCEQCVRHPDGE